MNYIKQLAEQALENSLFETIEPTLTVGEGENKVTIPLVFAEKFAELIVKECIELNKQELAFNAFERMLNRYKEHFGVEE